MRPRVSVAALALAAVMAVTPAYADVPAPAAGTPAWLAQPRTAAVAPSTGSPLRTAGIAALVAGIGAAALFVQRRRRRAPAGTLAAQTRVVVLDSTRIGPKAQLVLASVGGRGVLLGVTETSIRRLGSVDLGAPPAAQPAAAADKASLAFAPLLQRLVNAEARPEGDDVARSASDDDDRGPSTRRDRDRGGERDVPHIGGVAAMLAGDVRDSLDLTGSRRPRAARKAEPRPAHDALEEQASGLVGRRMRRP